MAGQLGPHPVLRGLVLGQQHQGPGQRRGHRLVPGDDHGDQLVTYLAVTQTAVQQESQQVVVVRAGRGEAPARAALREDLRGGGVQASTRRTQPEVRPGGGPPRGGQDRPAQPDHQVRRVARRVEQLLGLPGQIGREQRPPDGVQADPVGECGDVDHVAADEALLPEPAADGRARRGAHLVADRLEPLAVEGRGGQPPVLDPVRLGRGQQAGAGDPGQRGVLHGPLAPVAGRGLEHPADVGRVVEQERGRARHREGDQVAVLLGDLGEERERVGADRPEGARHVPRGRARDTELGGLHRL